MSVSDADLCEPSGVCFRPGSVFVISVSVLCMLPLPTALPYVLLYEHGNLTDF